MRVPLRILQSLLVSALAGCAATPQVPDTGTAFQLSGCPPLLNCVSSESGVGLYRVDPIALKAPLTTGSWARIRDLVRGMPGARLDESRFGYLKATYHSRVFHFPDVLELLLEPDNQALAVRSQSYLGLYDFNVNRSRVATLRQALEAAGLARESGEQP